MAETPYELFCEYRKLDVLLVDGQKIFGIDVHEYRNFSLSGGIGCESGKKEYAQLEKKIKEHGVVKGPSQYVLYYPLEGCPATFTHAINGEHVVMMFPIWRVFIGKGSPAHICQALRLAVAFGLVEGTQAALQDYCDRNIGLDCSGFAGNYLGGDWMSTPSSQFASTKLTNLSDVKAGTAIVWQNGKHVSLVDKVSTTEKAADGKISSINCWVAESTADRMFADGPDDGLNYSEYTISPINGQFSGFTIKRPYASKPGFHYASVYLGNNARVPLSEPYIF